MPIGDLNSIDTCELYSPCPGNVLQQCGCRKFVNQTQLFPLLADFSKTGKCNKSPVGNPIIYFLP